MIWLMLSLAQVIIFIRFFIYSGTLLTTISVTTITQFHELQNFFFSVGCRAIGKLAGIEGTDVYCLRNCFHNGAKNCPKDECECYGADDENEVSVLSKRGDCSKKLDRLIVENIYSCCKRFNFFGHTSKWFVNLEIGNSKSTKSDRSGWLGNNNFQQRHRLGFFSQLFIYLTTFI